MDQELQDMLKYSGCVPSKPIETYHPVWPDDNSVYVDFTAWHGSIRLAASLVVKGRALWKMSLGNRGVKCAPCQPCTGLGVSSPWREKKGQGLQTSYIRLVGQQGPSPPHLSLFVLQHLLTPYEQFLVRGGKCHCSMIHNFIERNVDRLNNEAWEKKIKQLDFYAEVEC